MMTSMMTMMMMVMTTMIMTMLMVVVVAHGYVIPWLSLLSHHGNDRPGCHINVMVYILVVTP